MTAHTEKPTLLRIGIIIESFSQPRWVRKSLEQVLATGLGEFALVIKVRPQKNTGGSFLYKLYNHMDRSRFQATATELVNIEDLFSEVPIVEDVEKVAEFNLDLLINFASPEWNRSVANSAEHGVWFHAFGDAPGFKEVMEDRPITNLSLKSLKGETEQIIYDSVSPTLSRFSVGVNNNTCYWKAAAFIARALRDLPESRTIASSNHYAGPAQLPGNAAMAHTFLKLSSRAAVRAFEKLSSIEQWILAYRFERDEFKYLIPPVGRFWADTFQINVDGRHYIFFEDYVNSAGRAHISVVEVDQNGIVSGPTEVLKLDCHLSYPFVFEWQGDYYMIPETGERNVVELYRASSFPLKWEPVKVLLEARHPLDTTLIEVNGTWWMFVNIQEEGVAVNWDELHLYYSNSPLGPWKPHARNPVVSDVRSARPAGRLFWANGGLFRPSQDSSLRYGYATTINIVTEISPSVYKETPVLKINPDWDNDILGVHTVNMMDDMTVIDCLMKRRKFGSVRLGTVSGSLDLLSSDNMNAFLKSRTALAD